MEYKILTAQVVFSRSSALEKLVQAVNEAIAAGWEPQGGVAFSESGFVAQAMIKRR
jgi:hypothetical protein